MDPSPSFCLSFDSLREYPPSPSSIDPNEWYQNTSSLLGSDCQYQTLETPELVPLKIGIQENPLIMYCDSEKYLLLQELKSEFNNPDFPAARDTANPFEKIKNSFFINRDALKLANIDAVHHITGTIPQEITLCQSNQVVSLPISSDLPPDSQVLDVSGIHPVIGPSQFQSDLPFTFCDIAGGPGGFTQYLQYRFPNSIGYGMTLKNSLDWNLKSLNLNRFFPIYGDDESGNLYDHWSRFFEVVMEREPLGVDLVVADGGFDIEENYDRQEFLSSRLILIEVLLALACSKQGKDIVIKVFDTVTQLSAQLLYIISLCFEKILIFKPITSRPANSERYIIAKNRRSIDIVQPFVTLLAYAAYQYTDEEYLTQIFDQELPSDFVEWLTKSNNESINRQLEAGYLILKVLNGDNPVIPSYNLHKLQIIWNLP